VEVSPLSLGLLGFGAGSRRGSTIKDMRKRSGSRCGDGRDDDAPPGASGDRVVIRIAISQAAFEAIARTLALGSTGFENKINENGTA
jgi:hypothetical protein